MGTVPVEQPRVIRALKNVLDARLNKMKEAVSMLQKACPHEHTDKKGRSSTGNYDPSADCYWFDMTCLDCNRRWQEDQ